MLDGSARKIAPPTETKEEKEVNSNNKSSKKYKGKSFTNKTDQRYAYVWLLRYSKILSN